MGCESKLTACKCTGIVLLVLLSASWLPAGQNKYPRAPLPAQIIAAKRVFIANGGSNSVFTQFEPGRAYDQFYAQIKEWGYYEIVNVPSDADVVLEVALQAQLQKYGKDLELVPTLRLAISDPKSHTNLWVFTEDLEAGRFYVVGGHQDEKFDKAIERIVTDVKALAGAAARK